MSKLIKGRTSSTEDEKDEVTKSLRSGPASPLRVKCDLNLLCLSICLLRTSWVEDENDEVTKNPLKRPPSPKEKGL